MGRDLTDKDVAALYGALIAVLIIMIVVLVFRGFGYIVTADTGFLTVVFGAVIAFALQSGRLTEFSVGGFTAKFQAAAKEKASGASIAPISQVLHHCTKDSLSDLPTLVMNAKGQAAVAIELKLPAAGNGNFDSYALLEYVSQISAVAVSTYVVVIDSERRFIGAVEADRLVALGPRDQLVNAANANDVTSLRNLPFLETHWERIGVDNLTALKSMQASNASFLVLVDGAFQPQEVAIRRQISDHLLLALAT